MVVFKLKDKQLNTESQQKIGRLINQLLDIYLVSIEKQKQLNLIENKEKKFTDLQIKMESSQAMIKYKKSKV